MEKLQITAKTRQLAETTPKDVRKQGLVPAELYGYNTQNLHLSVSLNEFEKLFRKAGESTFVELQTEDGTVHNVLIHDVQRHFLTSRPIHVDFLKVNMSEKLTATVQLDFVGESLAVKAQGGVLVKVISEVEVECLPKDLPHAIEVDIAPLATFEDVIKISDIKTPAGVTVLTDADEVVVKVQPPRDVEAELAPTEAPDISQIEVVKKDKTDQEAEIAD